MALYLSTFRWFEATSCKATPVGQLLVCSFHHLNYSMQNFISPIFCFSAHYGVVWRFEALTCRTAKKTINITLLKLALSAKCTRHDVVLSCFVFLRLCVGVKALCNRRNEDCDVLELRAGFTAIFILFSIPTLSRIHCVCPYCF